MEPLSQRIGKEYESTIRKDLVMQFGDAHDGVIEIPALTHNDEVMEVGYYYGDAKPKSIIGISSQVGCPAQCSFCELGSEKFGRNLSAFEMYDQVTLMLHVASRYGINIDAIEHKVNIAKTGEPLFNRNLLEALELIAQLFLSIKVSTVFPQSQKTLENFRRIADFASKYKQSVQIQISIISTSEEYRRRVAGIPVASFQEIRGAAEYWREKNPQGRKINASLILSEGTPCDVNHVVEVLPPELFRFRFRPCVETRNAKAHALAMITDESLRRAKETFADKGYEVGDWATPTDTELRFGLVSNVTRRRYREIVAGTI